MASVSADNVERAVNALLKWRDVKSKAEKPQLLEQDDFFYLTVSLKKVPAKGRVNPFKIPLSHPLIDPQQSEICLIIDDRPKSNLTKDAAQKKIKAEAIPVSKVLKLTKLRTDFKAFEAKRKLCDSYDLFLADRRVLPVLPGLLGKQFFKKKKIPVAVDLNHKGWKEQIENICGSALFFLGTGTCSVVKVGKAAMGKEEIVENVVAAIGGVAEVVPRKWGNIRAIHLKLADSLALPVYQTVPDLKLKIGGADDKGEVFDGEEANEEDASESAVRNKPKRSRIHEVRYMDTNLDESDVEDEEDISDEEDEVKLRRVDKKVKKAEGEVAHKEKKAEASKKSERSSQEDDGAKKKKKIGSKDNKMEAKPEKRKKIKK